MNKHAASIEAEQDKIFQIITLNTEEPAVLIEMLVILLSHFKCHYLQI
jgi:hypothetical protein